MHKKLDYVSQGPMSSHIMHAIPTAASHRQLPAATTNSATITMAPDDAATGLSKPRFIFRPPKSKIALLSFMGPSFEEHGTRTRGHLRKNPPDPEQSLEVNSKHLHSFLTWTACPPGEMIQ